MFNFYVNVYTSSMSPTPRTERPGHRANPAEARQRRQQALVAVRRQRVLEAARAAFLELGMDKASIREIARRAGYTAGALYSYFPSKEALYGALLAESLGRLNARVEAARPAGATPRDELLASARAFFDFYRDHPRDLDLGFYLFQGMQPRGLTPELDRALNARLHDALRPLQDALERLGATPAVALREVTALFAHIVGLLLLGHTGRIRMFGQAPAELLEAYLAQLVQRAGAWCHVRGAAHDGP